jgi:hypothetical protein
MTTPRGSPEYAEGQALPESTGNEQTRRTEAGACHFPVVDKDLTAPPGSCADGANYIIAGSPTGLWSGKAGQIATAVGTNAGSGWYYHTPIEGFTAYVQDENARYLYGGASWALDTSGGGGGTVTTASVVSANGFAGSVANATTTPAITLTTSITGVLKGNGTAISAATAGTDYYNPGGTDVAVADGGTGSSTASGARTNLGATTVGANIFTLTNPSAITFLRMNADNSVDALSASSFRTAIGAGSGGGDLLAANNLSDVANAATAGANLRPVESLIIACSDETTAITTGTNKVTFRMPYAFTLTAVRASVTTAPTGSTILIDINESGSTILSTKLMIDASEKTSTTAATPAVISDTTLADDAEITVDFDQVGSTIAGAGVKVYLIGHRT